MSNYPVPVGWKVIVEPKAGKTESESGIDLSATVDAQEHLVYLGTLVAVGEAAFTTKTVGGINMSEWKARPQVGDNVLFSPYGGLRIHRSGEKRPLILMNDTDIHGIVDNLDDYYAWIDV
jgi:co-chaperonin GroES (HSP10)